MFDLTKRVNWLAQFQIFNARVLEDLQICEKIIPQVSKTCYKLFQGMLFSNVVITH